VSAGGFGGTLSGGGTWLRGPGRRGGLRVKSYGEAQHDAAVAAGLNERFIRPQAEKTIDRLRAGQQDGQVSPGFDLDLAMEILSGPLYFRLLITQEPISHDHVDRVLDALFAGMSPEAAGPGK
jgi:hypothetical protein